MTDKERKEAFAYHDELYHSDSTYRQVMDANVKKLADIVDEYIYDIMVKEHNGQQNKQ